MVKKSHKHKISATSFILFCVILFARSRILRSFSDNARG